MLWLMEPAMPLIDSLEEQEFRFLTESTHAMLVRQSIGLDTGGRAAQHPGLGGCRLFYNGAWIPEIQLTTRHINGQSTCNAICPAEGHIPNPYHRRKLVLYVPESMAMRMYAIQHSSMIRQSLRPYRLYGTAIMA